MTLKYSLSQVVDRHKLTIWVVIRNCETGGLKVPLDQSAQNKPLGGHHGR